MVKALRKQLPDTFFDIHMMVSRPEQWVDEMAAAGANQYTFHLEATGTLITYPYTSHSPAYTTYLYTSACTDAHTHTTCTCTHTHI